MTRTDLIDIDGENRAIRSFLRHYLEPGLTIVAMREYMEMAGWDGCWPDWVTAAQEGPSLTKASAQAWIRHLIGLEAAPQHEARYQKMRADAVVVHEGLTGRVTVNFRLPTNYRDYDSAAQLLDVCVDAALDTGGQSAQGEQGVDTDRIEAICRAYEKGTEHGIARDGENSDYDDPAQAAAFILGYNAAATPGTFRGNLAADKRMVDWLGQNFFASELSDWDKKTTTNSHKWKFFAPAGVQGDIRRVLDAALARDEGRTPQ